MSNQHQYQADATDLSAIREVCERHGFCVVKNVLERTDLASLLDGMRAASRASDHSSRLNLLGLPELRHIYFDPRLLAIARALLGPHLVYDGESAINFEESVGAITLKPYANLHCDAQGMPDDLAAIWRSPDDAIYRAYRFAIYFQDYRRASGSLKVIVGSHRGDPARYEDDRIFTGSMEKQAIGPHRVKISGVRHTLYNVPSVPGDVVVWNLRTYHSAGARLFADDPAVAVHPRVENDIAASAPAMLAPPPGPRNALFFDYAAPCQEIDLYIKLRARPDERTLAAHLSSRADDPELMRIFAKHGIHARHDGLISALAVTLNACQGPAKRLSFPPAEVQEMSDRLYGLLQAHREYSPNFPLFDRERFEQAPSREAALASAIEDIVNGLQRTTSTVPV